MQEDTFLVDRRRFLQWGSAGLAAVAAESVFPAEAQKQTQPESQRQPPPEPITICGSEVEVLLDPADGLPWRYRLRKSPGELWGEPFGIPVSATLCRSIPRSLQSVSVHPVSHQATGNSAAFRFEADFGGQPAAKFTLRYLAEGPTVNITLEDIEELPGFQLIELSLPRLVSIREVDGEGWMVHGDQGGSFARLSEAQAGSLSPNRFWGQILGTLPIVMLGNARAMCVQETTAFMDGTMMSVVAGKAGRVASSGTLQVHRVNGSACYDLNLGSGAPLNCGNQNTPNLLVEQPSACRLDFLPVVGDPSKAWISAGRRVRERMAEIPSHFYDDKYVYGIRCDQPLFAEPSATFEQCRQMIARTAALIDHSPQIVHLWGWQFRGKDTGYPAVDVVNGRIGGYEGMMALMQAGEEMNATVTLSDNYDDAYRSSPAWNEAYIARRPDGQLWESRAWTGERSYILGLAKYMDGPGAERIRYTCERYRLRHTTHIDVLSYYAIRNDWDPEHPASGIRDLFQGRYRVLEGFAEYGVDVSSEALRYPMIGHISSFWYLTGSLQCPFGGSPIPLIPLIYGRSAVWGLSGSGVRGDAATVRILERFFGARPQSIVRADTETSAFLDAFYLGMVPFFLLRGRNLEDFTRQGEQTRIVLEGGVTIESDLTAKTVRISLEGHPVLQDDAVFCPLGDDRIACYAITAHTLTVHLPAAWKDSPVTGVVLYEDHREPATIHQHGRTVLVPVEARRPVMLYRHPEAAKAS